jgi:hypothetical protein
MRRWVVIGLVLHFSAIAQAQSGGTGVFSILNQSADSRTMAWGSYMLAHPDSDPLLSNCNPALLRDKDLGVAGLSYGHLYPTVLEGSAISQAAAAYAWKLDKLPDWNLGVQMRYIDYGIMDAYDAGGNPTGTVSANESAFGFLASRALRPESSWRFGIQSGVVYSVLGPYVSNGWYNHLGLYYNRPDSVLQLGFTVRNLGTTLVSYRDVGKEPLPTQVHAAVTFKPIHMPFRFQFVLHDLQRWDLTYDQYLDGGGKIDLNGNPIIAQPASTIEKAMRHLSFGTELVTGENGAVLLGYDHQRRMEMTSDIRRGTSGFSWGLRFKVSKFHLTYSSAAYFPSKNSNLLSLTINPALFSKP